MDAISDILASLKVSGQVVLCESYQPPWAIRIPAGDAFVDRLAFGSDAQVVPFHMVRRGSFELNTDTGEYEIVRAGTAIICMGSQSHVMSSGTPCDVTPFEDILDQNVDMVGAGGSQGATELVCGVFALRNTNRNPLLQALPNVMRLDIDGKDGSHSLKQMADLLTIEFQNPKAGSAYMMERLVELFCAEIIRNYISIHAQTSTGWVKGIADLKVGNALNSIHSNIAHAHSVDSLARAVGMSASRFAAHFRTIMGISPVKYLRQWRMTKAIEYIEMSDASIADIAVQVGYNNLAAFTRAFKSETGFTPGSFRQD